MQKSPNPAMTLSRGNVLSVSPIEDDHDVLERIFQDMAGVAQGEAAWLLTRTHTLASARTACRQAEYAVVICERDLHPGDWKDLLEITQRLKNPPFLIVTSQHADDYLWAEALNLGAHDVLAKPFQGSEVIRVVNLACMRWQRMRRATAGPKRAGMASSAARTVPAYCQAIGNGA